jgi:polar amino acid transport system substrate-binding protein
MRRIVLLAAALAALSGCGSTNDDALRASLAALRTPPPAAAPPAPPDVKCAHPEWSLRPAGPGPSVAAIRRRGHLIAGVDQNSLLLGYANPLYSPPRIEGFEIDLLRQLSRRMFGRPGAIKFHALTTSERISAAQDRTVDMVVDAFTITCTRAQQVAFSSPYLLAGQRVLVPSNSRARSLGDLRGKRVCATRGSTTIAALSKQSGVIPFAVSQRTDCLVALQRGQVDAITSDDAILRGFQAQDPYTKLIGPVIEPEPYGMAMSKRRPDLVRWVNRELARMRADGTWERLYRKWLPGTPRPLDIHYRD